MSELPWIFVVTLAILIVVGILLVLVVWKRKKAGKLEEPNYRAFFVMGIIWFPAGIVFMFISFLLDIPFVIGMPLFVMGLIYVIVGLANRDKWKKNE
jgi:hypothetical protein